MKRGGHCFTPTPSALTPPFPAYDYDGIRGMAGTQAAPKDRLFSKDAVTRSDQMPPSGDTEPQATRALTEACDLAGAHGCVGATLPGTLNLQSQRSDQCGCQVGDKPGGGTTLPSLTTAWRQHLPPGQACPSCGARVTEQSPAFFALCEQNNEIK